MIKKKTLKWVVLSSLLAVVGSDAMARGLFGTGGRNDQPSAPSAPGLVARNTDSYVRIFQNQWTAQDERDFGEFVRLIGESGCNTVESCFRHPNNPFRATDPSPAEYKFFSDCADFPFQLRGYFAWKRGLPFSFADDVYMDLKDVPPKSDGKPYDPRYSPKGNVVEHRFSIGFGQPVTVLFNAMHNQISSAMYRVSPDFNDRLHPSDFYSPAITRESIRPGTVIYDPNGHAAIIYSVSENGRIRYIDAHPGKIDQPVTRGTFRKKFSRSSIAVGAGFKNFRNQRQVALDGTNGMPLKRDQSGRPIVAAIPVMNEQIADRSNLQYIGTDNPTGEWNKAQFVLEGENLPFHNFVRKSIAVPGSKMVAEEEVNDILTDLCADARDRVSTVKGAIEAGIHLKSHLTKLPSNIFGTSGDWEDFSSPSRDARLRADFQELRELVGDIVAKPEKYEFQSLDVRALRADNPADVAKIKAVLLEAFKKKTLGCAISSESGGAVAKYDPSTKSVKTMNLFDLSRRLYSISFDPFLCEARRWGETDPSALKALGCVEDESKARWHAAQQRLQNMIERSSPYSMDLTLEQYEALNSADAAGTPAKGPGVSNKDRADLDTYGFLTSP